MALNDDLKAAIDKNLSAEIGTALKERLQKAEYDAILVKDLKQKLEEADHINKNLKSTLDEHREIDSKILKLQTVAKEAKEATTDKRIVELIEKHANEKVSMMQHLVLAVFANSKFKYSITENGNVPFPMPGQSYASTGPFNRTATGEGEGAPPPPPSSIPT